MKVKNGYCILSLLLFPGLAIAALPDADMALDEASFDDGVIAVYGTACENFRKNDVRSSVRLRATDKASFAAVEKISKLDDIKKEANPHDFNVLVYNLVDNYIEDLNIRTTTQASERICVEVTGYIKEEHVDEEIDKASQKDKKTDQTEASETASPVKEISETENQGKTFSGKAMTANGKKVLKEKKTLEILPSQLTEKKALIYFEPVHFYNNTNSTAHNQILKDLFSQSAYLTLTDKKELADYIIKSNILRAKVDPINNNTNRLQMVVSVEGKFKDGQSSTTEHQNRFVLFATNENEQETAAKLMQKLLTQAGEPILQKIDRIEAKKAGSSPLPPIITPAPQNSPKADR